MRAQQLRVDLSQTTVPQFRGKLAADRLCTLEANGGPGEPGRLVHQLVLEEVVGMREDTALVFFEVEASAWRELEAARAVLVSDEDVLARRCTAQTLDRCDGVIYGLALERES